MKKLNNFKFKIRALSPVHIGSGEVYEPTNFIIDEGELYEFDEFLFYKALSNMDKKVFESKLQDWMSIIKFYKDHRDVAKQIAIFNTPVTKKVEDKYNTIINKDGSKNKNQLEIHRVQRNPNSRRLIIPGSSIKGMLGTVFKIYPAKIRDNEVRQNLVISDALALNSISEIGYSYRKHKHPGKESRSSIPQMVEIIKEGATFIVSVSTTKNLEDIKSMMQRYLDERKETRFEFPTNGFVARVGKFSGKEYMVDDGTNVLNTYDKPVATHTLYETDEEEFGWLEFKLIDDVEYNNGLKEIKLQESAYYDEVHLRQKETVDAIELQKEANRKAIEEKELKEKEEVEREATLKAEEEVKLAAMTPIDKLIYSYDDISLLINDMKAGNIEDFENIKSELAQKIKAELQKDSKTWEKAKQKALKRKEYIESLL